MFYFLLLLPQKHAVVGERHLLGLLEVQDQLLELPSRLFKIASAAHYLLDMLSLSLVAGLLDFFDKFNLWCQVEDRCLQRLLLLGDPVYCLSQRHHLRVPPCHLLLQLVKDGAKLGHFQVLGPYELLKI